MSHQYTKKKKKIKTVPFKCYKMKILRNHKNKINDGITNI